MHDGDPAAEGRPLVSSRIMDIVVALLFLGASAIVLTDSVRIGFGWRDGEGPAPGYFPFYIAAFMAIASLINLARAAMDGSPGGALAFTTTSRAGRVISVLVPAIAYAGLIHVIGIYVSSAIFIAGFMLYFGREGVAKSILVGGGVALALFLMFERWFLVALPKGPLEAAFGF
jgi:putative tricarboxylic transport membrane protein